MDENSYDLYTPKPLSIKDFKFTLHNEKTYTLIHDKTPSTMDIRDMLLFYIALCNYSTYVPENIPSIFKEVKEN